MSSVERDEPKPPTEPSKEEEKSPPLLADAENMSLEKESASPLLPSAEAPVCAGSKKSVPATSLNPLGEGSLGLEGGVAASMSAEEMAATPLLPDSFLTYRERVASFASEESPPVPRRFGEDSFDSLNLSNSEIQLPSSPSPPSDEI